MPKYIGFVAYEGTGFSGWQSQADGSAIQDHLEKAFSTFLRHEVRITGSSRTDAGVHAERQVFSFETAVKFERELWLNCLRGLADRRIGVFDIQLVSGEFHPIRSAARKTYLYRIWNSDSVHPMWARWSWHQFVRLDLSLMRAAAKKLVGIHDFTSFCALDSAAKTRVRNLTRIQIVRIGPMVQLMFTGEGFLKQMVRALVGTLVSVGTGDTAVPHVSRILKAKNRNLAGATAPAHGLSLQWVQLSSERPMVIPRVEQMLVLPPGVGVIWHQRY